MPKYDNVNSSVIQPPCQQEERSHSQERMFLVIFPWPALSVEYFRFICAATEASVYGDSTVLYVLAPERLPWELLERMGPSLPLQSAEQCLATK